MRTWLAVGVVGFWSLAALVAACGGDDAASSSSGAPDGGGSTDAPVGSNDGALPTPGTVDVVASDLTVYIGSLAAIDASQTSATEFTWVVKTVPAGSGVTTQKLAGANTARPSFIPDLSGDYVVEVTARSGGSSGTKSVKVKAVAAPLFFMQTNFSEDPPYFEYRTVGNDKSNNHPIACRINGEPKDAGAAGQFLAVSFFLADIGMDWWEAPPGNSSRAAFTTFQAFSDGGSKSFLALGSTDTTCASPPAVVNHIVEDGGDPTSFLIQPRYSPNGARVAFIDKLVAGYTVEAVSYDGNDRRTVARFCSPGNDSCWSPALFPPRPQWFDTQTVGWARERQDDAGTTTGWEVMLANDSANPNPRVYMTCDGGVPRSIVFLKDGSVIANRLAEGTQIEDLLVLKPATPGGPCQVARNLTNLPSPGSYARDFVLSPDESEVVFVRSTQAPLDGGGSRFGGELYTAPVNGSAAPAPFGGAAQYAMFGGRYIASGGQIAWNGVVPFDAGAPDGSLVEAGAPVLRLGTRQDGTIQNLVASDIDAGVYVIGGGNGGSCDFRLCSFAAGQASGGGALAAAGAALVFAVRRKRRRSR